MDQDQVNTIDRRIRLVLTESWIGQRDIVIKFVWGEKRQGFLPDRQNCIPQDPIHGETVTILTKSRFLTIPQFDDNILCYIKCYQFDTDGYYLNERTFYISTSKTHFLEYLEDRLDIDYVIFLSPKNETSESIMLRDPDNFTRRRIDVKSLIQIGADRIDVNSRFDYGAEAICRILGEDTPIIIRITWPKSYSFIRLNWKPSLVEKGNFSKGKFLLKENLNIDWRKGTISFLFEFKHSAYGVIYDTFVDVALADLFEYLNLFPQKKGKKKFLEGEIRIIPEVEEAEKAEMEKKKKKKKKEGKEEKGTYEMEEIEEK
jgi:hypothetical protein